MSKVEVTVGNVDADSVEDYVGEVSAQGFNVMFGVGVWDGVLEDCATFKLYGSEVACARFASELAQAAWVRGEDCVLVDGSGTVELWWADGSVEEVS